MAAGGSQQEHQEQCNGGRRVARRVAAGTSGTSGTSGTDLEQSNGGRRVATRTAEEHQERRQPAAGG